MRQRLAPNAGLKVYIAAHWITGLESFPASVKRDTPRAEVALLLHQKVQPSPPPIAGWPIGYVLSLQLGRELSAPDMLLDKCGQTVKTLVGAPLPLRYFNYYLAESS